MEKFTNKVRNESSLRYFIFVSFTGALGEKLIECPQHSPKFFDAIRLQTHTSFHQKTDDLFG